MLFGIIVLSADTATDWVATGGFWVSAALLAVTIISVVCAFLAYAHQKKRSAKETACKLAAFYADRILPRYNFISRVFRDSGLEELAKQCFNLKEMYTFNWTEYLAFAERNRFDPDVLAARFVNIDLSSVLRTKITLGQEADREVILKFYAELDGEYEEGKIRHPELLRRDFYAELIALMNDLEYFSMCCQYGLADEAVVYQSLHQTFFAMVWLLYYTICAHNRQSGEDKYFTNIIWLFLHWRDRYEKASRTNQKKKATAQNKAILAQQRADRAKRSSDMEEGKTFTGKPLR